MPRLEKQPGISFLFGKKLYKAAKNWYNIWQ
jgi:hypothetical protein